MLVEVVMFAAVFGGVMPLRPQSPYPFTCSISPDGDLWLETKLNASSNASLLQYRKYDTSVWRDAIECSRTRETLKCRVWKRNAYRRYYSVRVNNENRTLAENFAPYKHMFHCYEGHYVLNMVAKEATETTIKVSFTENHRETQRILAKELIVTDEENDKTIANDNLEIHALEYSVEGLVACHKYNICMQVSFLYVEHLLTRCVHGRTLCARRKKRVDWYVVFVTTTLILLLVLIATYALHYRQRKRRNENVYTTTEEEPIYATII